MTLLTEGFQPQCDQLGALYGVPFSGGTGDIPAEIRTGHLQTVSMGRYRCANLLVPPAL
jgi:hypothetical protein